MRKDQYYRPTGCRRVTVCCLSGRVEAMVADANRRGERDWHLLCETTCKTTCKDNLGELPNQQKPVAYPLSKLLTPLRRPSVQRVQHIAVRTRPRSLSVSRTQHVAHPHPCAAPGTTFSASLLTLHLAGWWSAAVVASRR